MTGMAPAGRPSVDVQLRPLEEGDAWTSVHWRNDPEIWTGTGSRPDRVITIDDELRWIRRVIAEETSRRYAIIADGEYVGNIYLVEIADEAADYHIFIGSKSHWGKGVARAASLRLIEIAREELRLRRIRLAVRTHNAAALSLYRSLGFEEVSNEDDFIGMTLSVEGCGPSKDDASGASK